MDIKCGSRPPRRMRCGSPPDRTAEDIQLAAFTDHLSDFGYFCGTAYSHLMYDDVGAHPDADQLTALPLSARRLMAAHSGVGGWIAKENFAADRSQPVRNYHRIIRHDENVSRRLNRDGHHDSQGQGFLDRRDRQMMPQGHLSNRSMIAESTLRTRNRLP